MKNINSVITGTGSYLPEFVLDNKMLEQTIETYNEWIVSRTGIKERRMEQDKLTYEMIGEASKRALENAGISPDKIDMIIVSTVTPDYNFPSVACLVQNYIQADNAVSFDVAAACAGFVFVLDIADLYIKSGRAKNILVASGDIITRTADYFDRSNCILFGDGAGAAVLSAVSGDPGEPESGVIASYIASECDGLKPFFIQSALYEPSQIFDKETKLFKGNVDRLHNIYISQNGREVMQFVTRVLPKALDEVLRRADKTIDDIKYIILHQANKRIIDHVVDKCRIDREKVPLTIDKYGNTSSSTVPILLNELNENNLLKRGDLIALAGFGSGLVYGAVLVKW